MIRHILLISFFADVSVEHIDSVSAAFLSIPERIPGITGVEWGVNDSPEGKGAGYTHCVMMIFADEQARKQYLSHPEHDALKQILRPVRSGIIVFDYVFE